MTKQISQGPDGRPLQPQWGAVVALSMCVAGLITAEFLPVSLLTPMASDLGISEGLAGQAVTATALTAIVSSLLISRVTRGLDRRLVVLAFSIMLAASSVIVALAPNFPILAIGRLLLGFALGGFWAMSASLAMRLVPEKDTPKALSIVFGGVSVGFVVAPPFGSFFGDIIGWRGVFYVAAAFGALCWAWQLLVLPSMPSEKSKDSKSIWKVARLPGVAIPMVAIFAVFAGQFAYFTYMRPFYESVSGYTVEQFSAVLLIFGVSNFIGTSLSSFALTKNLKTTLLIAPLAMALAALALLLVAGHGWVAAFPSLVWGFAFGFVPVGWSTWVTRHLPNDAEGGGGLQVAVIQLANAAGAGFGGYLFEIGGAKAPVEIAGIAFAATILLVIVGVSPMHQDDTAAASA